MIKTHAVALLLSSSLVFGGCTLAQNVQQKATEQAAKSAIETMLVNIKDDVLRKHLAAQFSKMAYKIVTTSSGKGAETTTMRMEVNGSTAKFRTTSVANGKEMMDYIMIGDTTYVKDQKDGKWWKEVAKKDDKKSPAEDTFKFSPDEMKKQFEEQKEKTVYKSLGKEACGTLMCYKYEESTTDNPEGKRTFWFDDKQYLLRKEESKFGEFTSTMVYSYDDTAVTAPSPTKDVPEGKSAFEMMYAPAGAGTTGGGSNSGGSGSSGTGGSEGPSQAEIDALIKQYGGGTGDTQE